MEQYIKKSALVAEIEKCIDRCNTKKRLCPVNTQVEAICYNKISAYKEVLGLIDTLAVIEVDLDWQDIYSILYIKRIVQHEFGDHEYSNEGLCQEVLKRFKAQKG